MVIKIPALICCALYNVRNVRWLSRFNTTHKFSSGFLVGSRIELLELAIDQKFGKCLNCVYNSFLIEYVSKRDPTSLPPSIFRRYKNGNIFLIIADELQTTAGSSPLNTIYTDNLFIEIFPFFFFYFLNLIFSWRGTRQNVKFSIKKSSYYAHIILIVQNPAPYSDPFRVHPPPPLANGPVSNQRVESCASIYSIRA